MPELTRFFGITIKMNLKSKEHVPPHIHAYYGEYMITIDITKLVVIKGKFPRNQESLAIAWTCIHQKELIEIWNSQTFKKVEPLK